MINFATMQPTSLFVILFHEDNIYIQKGFLPFSKNLLLNYLSSVVLVILSYSPCKKIPRKCPFYTLSMGCQVTGTITHPRGSSSLGLAPAVTACCCPRTFQTTWSSALAEPGRLHVCTGSSASSPDPWRTRSRSPRDIHHKGSRRTDLQGGHTQHLQQFLVSTVTIPLLNTMLPVLIPTCIQSVPIQGQIRRPRTLMTLYCCLTSMYSLIYNVLNY